MNPAWLHRMIVLADSEVKSLTVADQVLGFVRNGDMISLRERGELQGALCINAKTLSLWYGVGPLRDHRLADSMRVIVCGGREYANRERIAEVLGMCGIDTVVVTGGARGTDRIAHEEAVVLGFETEILDSGIDLVIAFPGRRGTADMIDRAERAGVEVRRFL